MFDGLTTYIHHIYNHTNNITWIFQKSTENYITFINYIIIHRLYNYTIIIYIINILYCDL